MNAHPRNVLYVQAHMQARYVILRVLMENTPPGCVTVQVTTGADGKPDLLVELDRTLINTAGKKAIGEFLEKIQVQDSICSSLNVCRDSAVYMY